MASGKVHHSVNRIAIIPVWLISAFVIDIHPVFGVALFFGGFMAVFITPDTDLGNKLTYPEHKLIRNFGIFGHAIIWWWRPYGTSIPHRHWMSHAPIVSTAIRIVYLLCPPLFWLLRFRHFTLRYHAQMLSMTVLLVVALQCLPPTFAWMALGSGLFLGALPLDILHWIFDR